MSVKVEPILNDDLNSQYFIKFEFPIPNLKIPAYDFRLNDPDFVQGTSGTNSFTVVYPDTTDPEFPGFEVRSSTNGGAGTNVNYVSEVIRLESLLFESPNGFKDLLEIVDIQDTVVGDTDVLYFSKEFRFSINNFTWSAWETLSEANLNKYLEGFKNDSFIQFRYDALDIEDPNYDTTILINKPDGIGWFKVYGSTSFYEFGKDYPDKGTLEYTVGFGSDGDYYINTNTNQIHSKTGGFWSSPYNLMVTETTSGNVYQPSFITDDIYDNALTGTFAPLERDYTLSKFDLLFGSDNFDTAEFGIPQKGDNVFLNPAFQNIKLSGNETLRINHTPRYIDPTYVPRLFLQDLTIYTNKHIFDVDPISSLDKPGDQIVLKPPFLLKAYSFDDFCVEATGLTEDRTLDIKFRWSNNNKQWSGWYPLTDANISCLKPDPLSFFYIEIVFTRTGTDETGKIGICDLILNGNYQNVTNDYEKLGKFGMRSDCNYGGLVDGELDTIPKEWQVDDGSGDEACATNLGTFNPYDFNRSLNLYEKLANDVSNIFGWEVDFYKTSPDNNGRDFLLHEYQLFNVIAKSTVKVVVPDNQFPDNTIMFNQFDLSLFDTFEIHITRAEFHKRFGIGRRPEKKDFLFFCQTNRMYQIEHAQTYKEFMNASIYYKVVLKKYQDRKNVNNGEFTDSLKDLINVSSIDKMFKDVVETETKKVANKEILENLTEKDEKLIEPHIDSHVVIEEGEEPLPFKSVQPIHSDIFAPIVDYQLLNGPNLISKNHYDLEPRNNNDAINYMNMNNVIGDCSSRAFTCWFNIKSYKPGQVYNMIDSYNSVLANGYKIDFIDGRFEIVWFGQIFDIDVSIAPNCWFGLVVNFDQNKHKLELGIYKIKANPFGSSTELDEVEYQTFDLTPSEFDGDLAFRLKGSPMLWSNMRFFSVPIPKDQHQKVLNQYIVKDTSHMILADNATRKVISPHHKF